MADKINASNQLHGQLRSAIYAEKESLAQAIGLYYDSLLREVELNYQRRHAWLQELTRQYQGVRQEMGVIQDRLQGEKHLRTIIMWNRLRPE
jgi:S-methylmethionine-dependent homocysteine/selenocysteine methylase